MEQPTQNLSSDIFIQSNRFSVTYGQLAGLTKVLAEEFKKYGENTAETNQIVIYLEESELSVAIIAACWLLEISFIPFSSHWSVSEINKRLNEINPDLIISSIDLNDNILNTSAPICLAKPHWLDQTKHFLSDFIYYGNVKSVFAKIFTSGSTGKPKLVPLLRRQMVSATRASQKRIPFLPGESWLLCLPLSHIGGISIILRALICRATVFFAYPFEPEKIIEQLTQYQSIQIISLVPTLLYRLLQNDENNQLGSLKTVLIGGGPIALDLLRRSASTNIPVQASYGMTETCAQIASCRIAELDLKTGYGLRIFAPNRVEVRDEANNPLEANTKGYIWLRGPQVFDGYDDGVAEDYFDKNGWFCTNDYGWIDANGNLRIAERADDVIITGGENVMPREIEHHLKKVPEILDAAVIGVPDKEWGQRIVAYIIPKEMKNRSAKVLLELVQNRLKPHLSNYKLPRELIITSSLPKTSLGKTKRTHLRQIYLHEK